MLVAAWCIIEVPLLVKALKCARGELETDV